MMNFHEFMRMMNIILTNDDGILAPGLHVLHNVFSDNHNVVILAPDRERSAVGHGITLREPVRIEKVKFNGMGTGYAVSGTPADCIKMGAPLFFGGKPDLVISGINPGSNMGANLNYSGTVAAAREAALLGFPAIAVSIHSRNVKHYDTAAEFTMKLSNDVRRFGLPYGTFLNVNVPDLPMEEIRCVRVNRHRIGLHADSIEKRTDPRNREYYWYGIEPQALTEEKDTDSDAVASGCISVTPVKTDMTDYKMMKEMDGWSILT